MASSSPLAALRPAPPPTWGRPSHGLFSNVNPFGSSRPKINDQLLYPRTEFFDIGAIRGSSPSASLAADLSQNFCLDNEFSPRFPTPRRALFTSQMAGRDSMTTPPLPPSSPRIMNDAMDISPIRHLSSAAESLDVDMMIESPLIPRSTSMSAEVDLLNDGHRRSNLLANRLQPGNQASSLRFDVGASGMSPEMCFEDSPPRERRPQTANSPSIASGPFRKHLQFSGLASTRGNGSPSAHGRHGGNPINRSRRQYRRSHSMFENPGDAVNGKTGASSAQVGLQSIRDVVETDEPVLPHFFPDGENDGIPRISRETFVDFLDGKYNESFTQKIVIDCRFEYEYEGGHIDSAINCNDKELLARQLFETPMEGKPILIFHCEYSVHRAPRMARHIRAEDRMFNAEFYPRLSYPEIYILEGGYSDFFNTHRNRCYPQAYVEMDAEEHANTCEREMGKLQQKRKGLGRAKTFAFGHREPISFESPTASRISEQPSPGMMIGNSPILGNYRSPARRMASY